MRVPLLLVNDATHPLARLAGHACDRRQTGTLGVRVSDRRVELGARSLEPRLQLLDLPAALATRFIVSAAMSSMFARQAVDARAFLDGRQLPTFWATSR